MLIDELIKVVEKQKYCLSCCRCSYGTGCKNYIDLKKRKEMYNDILMRLKQEKWVRDKMEEMRVEEVN